MSQEKKASEQISAFLKFLEQAEKDYEWAIQEESKAEMLTQDYLHQLELVPLTYHDRAKVAKQLRECRIHRRAAKDILIVNGSIVDFVRTEKGKVLISQLQQVVGKVRKEERHMQERTYTPKVLKQEEFQLSESRP